MLRKWQRVHRIIGSADPGWIVEEVILDSLLFVRALGGVPDDVLDLGAGAGVPGVPLRIVSPAMRLTMVEARQRRASFLAAVIRELPLVHARVIAERAERLIDVLGGRFDAVVMRCAGAAEDLIPLARRFVRPGGMVVASAWPGARPIGGAEVVRVGAPGNEVRTFLVATA